MTTPLFSKSYKTAQEMNRNWKDGKAQLVPCSSESQRPLSRCGKWHDIKLNSSSRILSHTVRDFADMMEREGILGPVIYKVLLWRRDLNGALSRYSELDWQGLWHKCTDCTCKEQLKAKLF